MNAYSPQMMTWARSSQWREECSDDHMACGVAHNRVCGDKLKLQILFSEDGNVIKARHTGESCALTLAAASALCELSEGKSRNEVKQLLKNLRSIVFDGALVEGSPLNEFSPIHKLPSRYKCATLAIEAIENILNEDR
jgi:nitrogen fixation NifU-like protein